MIHTATQSAKFKKLVRRLRPYVQSCPVSPEAITVGLLESLWHVTVTSARRGDIGRIDNETIAEMVGWYDDPDVLIDCLIETGWLDSHDEYRLVIHDWSDHAPSFIKKNIGRIGGFCDGKQSHDGSSEHGSTDLPAQERTEAATPNQTQPNQTKLNPTQPNQTGGGWSLAVVSEMDLSLVTRLAKRLRGKRPGLDVDYCWRVCFACERLEPGMASSVVSSIESGKVNNAQSYIDGAIRKRCAEFDLPVFKVYEGMPTPKQTGPPPEIARELASAVAVKDEKQP